jgi:hypothetical protein
MSRLDHRVRKIRDLVGEYHEGKLVIPEFQRDYVWKPARAPTLLDSLYRGWPISSLLVWQSDGDERVETRRDDPRAVRGATRWLIDGQQRIITLARIKYGDEGLDVVFHPNEQRFQRPNAASRQDPNWISVARIWEKADLSAMVKALPDNKIGRATQERLERVHEILDYEIPIVEMIDHDFTDAVEAFTRINTLGYRLNTADIAKIAAKHSGFIRRDVAPFLKKLHDQGWTRIHVMHLFRACAFVAQPDGRNRTPLHELEKKEVERAWADTERATEEALGIIRGEFGLLDMTLMWSGALLVPVIAVCARTKPRDRNTKELAGWVALAALHHRYSGSTETALEEDLRACRKDDPVGALLIALRAYARPNLRAKGNDFAGKLADRSALFAAWIACKHRNARDFLDGGDVILQRDIDRHHILPRSRFGEDRRAESDVVANIAFIAGRSNQSLSDDTPDIYLANIKKAVLTSQCVPTEKKLWSIARADEFWSTRRDELADSFNAFLESHLQGRHLRR